MPAVLKKENSSGKRDFFFFMIFFVFFLILFKNFFFTENIFFERDSTSLEIPTRLLCKMLLKQGNFALWTDAHGNGQPFLANPKNCVLYPTTFLYLILPFLLAYKLHYLLHVLGAWSGLYFFGKSWKFSSKTSFFVATTFISSGIFLSSFEFYNHIASLCWMFWILLFIKKETKNSFLRLIILSFLWAFLLLSGTPYVAVLTVIFGFFQSLLLRGRRKKMLFLFASPLILSLFIASAQLLPSAELLLRSDRESLEPSLWSLEPIQLLNLIFPSFLGDDRSPNNKDYWGSHLFDKSYPLYYSLYSGIGVVILFFFGIKRPWTKNQHLLLTWLFISLLLSAGKYFPLYAILKPFPPFSTIRYPVKYLMGSIFCMCMISGAGFENLFVIQKVKKKTASIPLTLSLGALLLYLFIKKKLISKLVEFFVIDSEDSAQKLSQSLEHGLLLSLLLSLLLLLFFILKKVRKQILWTFIALVILDLGLMNMNINPVTSFAFFKKPLFIEKQNAPLRIHREDYSPYNLRKEIQSGLRFSNYLRESIFPFTGLGINVHYLYNKDFYGLYSKEYNTISNYLRNCKNEDFLKILEDSLCDYYITHHPRAGLPAEKIKVEGYDVYFQKIQKKGKPSYLVYETINSKSLEETLKTFLKGDFTPEEKAIVRGNTPLLTKTSSKNSWSLEVVEEEQGKSKYSIQTSAEAVLVVRGNYFPGWKAKIDGKKTRIFPINLTSKGVIIPRGRHEVRLEYFPSSFLYGSLLSILSLVALTVSSLFLPKKVKSMNLSQKFSRLLSYKSFLLKSSSSLKFKRKYFPHT